MKIEKCKVDSSHMVDSYGCFDCAMEALTMESLKIWDKEDETS